MTGHKGYVMRIYRCLLLLTCMLILAADWPQYRGPNRDDRSAEKGLLQEWPTGGPPLLWTFREAGIGYSGPAIVANRLYTIGGRGDSEFLIALDLSAVKGGTVAEAWSAKVGPLFDWKGNNWSAGPSATPTVDGSRVFALGGNGDLVCANTDGRLQWRVSLPKDLEGQVNPIGGGPKGLGWGFTASPLVDGEQLVVVPGGPKGTLAALDKATGKVIWRSTELTDQAAYTSPEVRSSADPTAFTTTSAPTVVPSSSRAEADPTPPLRPPTLAPVPAPTVPSATSMSAASYAARPSSASGTFANTPPRPRSKSTAAGTIGTTSPGSVPTG